MKVTINTESGDSMSFADCECKYWCHDGNHWTEELIANHHYNCPKFETEFQKNAMVVIKDFVNAVNKIEAETGQIPDSLLAPYNKVNIPGSNLCIDIHKDRTGCVLD